MSLAQMGKAFPFSKARRGDAADARSGEERRRLQIGGVPIRVHPLLPLLLVLAAHTGALPQALALLSALIPHELAHLAAARAMGVNVAEMELTPFGAAARLTQTGRVSEARIAICSMAGPCANLLFALIWASLAYAGWLPVGAAKNLLRPNILLMAINLLPALPLDGGRALCALIGARIGRQKAVRAFTRLGCALSVLVAAWTIYIGATKGVWNIALLGCAVYLAACAAREEEAARTLSAEALIYRRDELKRRGHLPVRRVALPESATVADAIRLIRPGKVHAFTLYDDDMRPLGEIWEGALLTAASGKSGAPLHEFIRDVR